MEPLVQLRVRPRLPGFLQKPVTAFPAVQALKNQLRAHTLNTVCESARCPNMHECFARGAATFMILGNVCTRGCGFCAVPKHAPPETLDPQEPQQVARMAHQMGLRHIVITSVNRDDLADGGAAHFAATIRAVREALPEARVEVLTPDFEGRVEDVATVLAAGPHVFNHNLETVPRLYRKVRPQANYRQSLDVLAAARRLQPGIATKSGIMVGLGETEEEVTALLADLREAQVDLVTIGQYLQPTRRNMPVAEYVPLDRYERWRNMGKTLGFRAVFAGPFVRSSYMAEALDKGDQ